MSPELILGLSSLAVSLGLGVLVARTNARANKTSEKKVNVDQEVQLEANQIDRFEANMAAFDLRVKASEQATAKAEDRAAKAEERAAAADKRAIDAERNVSQLLTRVGELEAKDIQREKRERAYASTLKTAAEQWPSEHPGPVFSLEDIADIEDTFPKAWRPNGRARTA